MTWQGPVNSDQLALRQAYTPVQQGGGDLLVTLNPGEAVNVMLDYGVPSDASDLNGDVIIPTSADGVKFESNSQAERFVLRKDNPELDTEVKKNVVVAGVKAFKVLARNRTYTDGAGTDPVGSEKGTLDVQVNEDGVNAS